jgi:hypothetical protein
VADLNPGQLLGSPENIAIGSATAPVTRDLGYLLGLYAGYGTTVDGKVTFRFGTNDQILKELNLLVRSLYPSVANGITEKDTSVYSISWKAPELVDLFHPFGDKLTRNIPAQYRVADQAFLTGIMQGLLETDKTKNMSRYLPVSEAMAEYFIFAANVLGVTVDSDAALPSPDTSGLRIYPLFIKHADTDGSIGKVISIKAVESPVDMWDITVEGSGSLVIDNIIVSTQTPAAIAAETDVNPGIQLE